MSPMKTQEELNALKEEVETLNKKLAELTEEEIKDVSGGGLQYDWRDYGAGEFVTDAYKDDTTSQPGGGNTLCG